MVIAALILSFQVYGQKADEDKVHAMFLYNFTKYIEWSNHEDYNEFQIAVLGDDESILNALKWMAETKTANGKPIRIIQYGNIGNIDYPQMLYVDVKHKFNIQEILLAIKGKNILLVSHNYGFNVSMINFIIVNDKLKYELTEQRITDEGFTIMPELVANSIKSRSDWKNLYIRMGTMLESEKNKVELQNDEITKQRKLINKHKSDITSLNNKIVIQKDEFADLVQQTHNQEVELNNKSQILTDQKKEIEIQKGEVLEHERAVARQRQILRGQESKIKRQNGHIQDQSKILGNQLAKIEDQRLALYSFIIILILVLFTIFQIYRGYRIKRKSNIKLEEKNRSIVKQHKLIHTKNKEIVDSIRYARLIQNAILPNPSDIHEHLPEIFILYKPKDIVSGDFYWYAFEGKRSIIAACDCTGHGVPGGFVSMIGNDLLNQIVIEKEVADPAKILKELHRGVVKALDQKSNGTPTIDSDAIRDGMDLALCSIDMEKQELLFSGAVRPLWVITKNGDQFSPEDKITSLGDNRLVQVKGDRHCIGGVQVHSEPVFTSRKIKLQKGDTFYLSSDGYPDQFGGPGKKDRSFSKKRLLNLLLSIQDLSMDEQQKKLDYEIEKWRGEYEQTDDICLIGVKI